jgi:hypothetical protein
MPLEQQLGDVGRDARLIEPWRSAGNDYANLIAARRFNKRQRHGQGLK